MVMMYICLIKYWHCYSMQACGWLFFTIKTICVENPDVAFRDVQEIIITATFTPT